MSQPEAEYSEARSSNTHAAASTSEGDDYLGLKPELRGDKARAEMHGDNIRYEKSSTVEIKELPGSKDANGIPSCYFHHEIEGDSCSYELGADG